MKRNREYLTVANSPGLVRDVKTGAILNINSTEIRKARALKSVRIEQKKQGQVLREDVDKLKDDIQDIKNLLAQLVEKM